MSSTIEQYKTQLSEAITSMDSTDSIYKIISSASDELKEELIEFAARIEDIIWELGF